MFDIIRHGATMKCHYIFLTQTKADVLRYASCSYFQNTRAVPFRLRVFENGVLRNVLGPKWDKVTCEWRRLGRQT